MPVRPLHGGEPMYTSEAYKGVGLNSRKEIRSEIAAMREIVDWLGDLAENLDMIFCDSKADSCYTISLKSGR